MTSVAARAVVALLSLSTCVAFGGRRGAHRNRKVMPAGSNPDVRHAVAHLEQARIVLCEVAMQLAIPDERQALTSFPARELHDVAQASTRMPSFFSDFTVGMSDLCWIIGQFYKALDPKVFPDASVVTTESFAYNLHLYSPFSDLDVIVLLPHLPAALASPWSTSVFAMNASSPTPPRCARQRHSFAAKVKPFIDAALDAFRFSRPIVLYVKYYLHVQGLRDPFHGGNGSYVLSMLVMLHLPQAESVAACLLRFFGFYGHEFDTRQHCVSEASGGQLVAKNQLTDLPPGPALCVLDPSGNNLNIALTAFNFPVVRARFEATVAGTYESPTRLREAAIPGASCDWSHGEARTPPPAAAGRWAQFESMAGAAARIAVAALAVVACLALCSDGAKRSKRSVTNKRVPSASNAVVRDAVVLLEQARIMLCEAEKQLNLPGRRLPMTSFPMSNLYAAAGQFQRVPELFTGLTIIAIELHSVVVDLSKALMSHDKFVRICSDANVVKVLDARHKIFEESERMTREIVDLSRRMSATRDSHFADVPRLRFWNSTDVQARDVLNAADELQRQIEHDEEMLDTVRLRNELWSMVFPGILRYTDSLSKLLVHVYSRSALCRMECGSNSDTLEWASAFISGLEDIRDALETQNGRCKSAVDTLGRATSRLDEAHRTIDQIRYLLVTIPDEETPKKQKKKVQQPVNHSPVSISSVDTAAVTDDEGPLVHEVPCEDHVSAETRLPVPEDDGDGAPSASSQQTSRRQRRRHAARRRSRAEKDVSCAQATDAPSDKPSLESPQQDPVLNVSSRSEPETKPIDMKVESAMSSPSDPEPEPQTSSAVVDPEVSVEMSQSSATSRPGDPEPKPETAIVDVDSKVSAELSQFMAIVTRKRNEHAVAANDAFRTLASVIRTVFPDATVVPTGSYAYKLHLYTPISDLDLAVYHPSIPATRGLPLLQECLLRERVVTAVTYIRSAAPFLKVTMANRTFPVDIAWNAKNAARVASMLDTVKQNFAFSVIVLYVKYYLHSLGLNSPFHGGIGSYLLYMLVIFHLQANHAVCSGSAGACLRWFFGFYGREFNADRYCISVTGGSAIIDKTRLEGVPTTGLCVLDPFNDNVNIGLTAFNFPVIRARFHDLFVALSRSQPASLPLPTA
ncbi:hypothetical protein PBRA_006637 [Plasmodiophora brassicae]|uniref:Uncharacterized protein n=2 Tax=Plasmodiophora brassicae TaxID=37360 RepID=A0A0G4IT46_PLABS|nr:hypothetical protein PBRA_006637 [Plasmodiophora brassicae]